jgi:hypothetical protein
MSVELVALILLWLAGYAVACTVWPFARCRWCRGTGKRRSPTGRAFGHCRHCRGTARRVRLGRRLWTAATGTDMRGK